MWYMYVVKCSDLSLYCGITKDVEKRVYDHNHTKRAAKYTRSRRPVSLVFSTQYPDRSVASRAEAIFKKLTARQKRILIHTPADLVDYLREKLN